MPSGPDAEKTATHDPTDSREPLGGQKSYAVVLEDIASGIETADSFAIKFSLLARIPLSKMKHVARSLPATIWSGRGRARAESILALIEEAGGKGTIVEAGSAAAQPAFAANPAGQARTVKGRLACRWCGFPMKEDEAFCGFCLTAVGEVVMNERPLEPAQPAKLISRNRLIRYAFILAVGIVIIKLFIR